MNYNARDPRHGNSEACEQIARRNFDALQKQKVKEKIEQMKSDEFNRAAKTDDEEEIPVEVFPKDNFDRVNLYVKEMREPNWK